MEEHHAGDRQHPVSIFLTHSPNHWKLHHIIFWFIAAILKHILAFIGYTAQLKVDTGARQSFKLPRIEVAGQLKLDDNDFAQFRKALIQQEAASPEHDGDPVNPFFLVAMTTPLLIRILADRRCPVKPLGAVNTRNALIFHDPSTCRSAERLRNASKDGKLSYAAMFGGHSRPGFRRKRGMEFCITICVFLGDQTILEQQLWFLQFLPKHTEPRFEPLSDISDPNPKPSSTLTANSTGIWLDPSDPKRWAASCKDYNPIHISALGARLFGFRSVIAHGNHVAALAVHKLLRMHIPKDPKSLTAEKLFWYSTVRFKFEVHFARPITLPSRVSSQWHAKEHTLEAFELAVYAKDKLCLSGSCDAAAPTH